MKNILAKIGFCLAFIVLLLVIIFTTLNDKASTNNTLIANISTFIMAFFTITYVVINNNMFLQAKNDFNFSSKPLPYVTKALFNIEEPRIWANPFTKSAIIFSRYNSILNVKNISNDSALCVDVESSLFLYRGKKIVKEIKSISNYYNRIEPNEELKVEFNYPMDVENQLVHSFNGNTDINILFENTIYFRNYLGSTFKTSFVYILNTDSKNDKIIKELSKRIFTYQEKYKTKLDVISKYICNKMDYRSEFDEIANEINKEYIFYFIEPIEVPIEKTLEPLSYKEYKKIRERLNHNKIVRGKSNHCGAMLVE